MGLIDQRPDPRSSRFGSGMASAGVVCHGDRGGRATGARRQGSPRDNPDGLVQHDDRASLSVAQREQPEKQARFLAAKATLAELVDDQQVALELPLRLDPVRRPFRVLLEVMDQGIAAVGGRGQAQLERPDPKGHREVRLANNPGNSYTRGRCYRTVSCARYQTQVASASQRGRSMPCRRLESKSDRVCPGSIAVGCKQVRTGPSWLVEAAIRPLGRPPRSGRKPASGSTPGSTRRRPGPRPPRVRIPCPLTKCRGGSSNRAPRRISKVFALSLGS